MRKFSFCLILFSFSFFCENYSQGQFKIGVSTGLATAVKSSTKIGMASLANVSYSAFDNLDIFISSGIFIFANGGSEVYGNKLTPVIFGTKFYFTKGLFSPYIEAEIQKVFGEKNYGYNNLNGPFSPDEVSYSRSTILTLDEYLFASGLGVSHVISKNFELDFQVVLVLSSKTSGIENGRILIGANYLF